MENNYSSRDWKPNKIFSLVILYICSKYYKTNANMISLSKDQKYDDNIVNWWGNFKIVK